MVESLLTVLAGMQIVSDEGGRHAAVRFRRAAVTAVTVTAIIAAAGLLGFVSGFWVLGSIRTTYVPMAHTTAACFLILSAVLSRQVKGAFQGYPLRMAITLVLLVAIFSLFCLVGSLAGYDMIFGESIFPVTARIGDIKVGRMSPLTAVAFLVSSLGTGLLLLRSRYPDWGVNFVNWSAVLGISSLLLGATVILSYLYGEPFMYGTGTVPMAVTTAMAFVSLGIALVAAAGPASFPVSRMIGNSTSALLSRIFLPLVVMAVLLQSFLGHYVATLRSVNEALILAFLVVALAGITAFAVDRVSAAAGRNIDEINRKLLLYVQEVRESEEHHRIILKTAMDGIWLLGNDGRLLEVNDAYCRMSGYSAEELLTMEIGDLEVTESPAEIAVHIQKVIEEGEDRFETKHRRRDGTVYDVEISAQYLMYRGGQFITFIHDISNRKKAEAALKESERLFRDSQRAASIGSYKCDFIADRWNSTEVLDAIFGIDRSYPRTVQGWLEIVHPDDREMMASYLHEEVVAGKKPFAREYRIVRQSDGELRWVFGSGKVECDGSGKVVAMIGTIQDITERKRAEEERAKLESQLQQAQRMESVGRLAGGVAHDFNNMLGVILGHAEIGLMRLDPASPVAENLKQISNAADRSAALTRQLLAFARKQVVVPKLVDLNDAVTGMLKMLQRLIGENIAIAWQPGHDLWSVKIDPSQLDQILANLCVNARDAIADTGRISIDTANIVIDMNYSAGNPEAAAGEYVRLNISDDGSGMDKETVSHIFEPFYTTKSFGKGTGLGLATVYGAVKQNNGFINIYSEPGQGTTFSVYLPREVEKGDVVETPVVTDAPLRGDETILLVEDEPSIREVTALMLQEQGYRVLTAGGPGEAIQLSREFDGQIQMLLTDVIMPEMNGRDLANKLLPLHPQMKCLFMSGYTADIISHHGLLEEGIHFIQKPFSLTDMAAKVREVLNG